MFQWMKPNRKRCYPFLKPVQAEGKDDYRFFDLESITSDLIIYEDALEEGRKLLQEGHLSHLRTVYGYPRGSQDELLQCRACLTEAGADDLLPPVEAVFKRDALLGLRCRVEKCPNVLKSFLPGIGREIEICCHEAALFLALDEELQKAEVGDMTDYRSASVLNAFSKQIRGQSWHPQEESRLEPIVHPRNVSISVRLNELNHLLTASFRVGTEGKSYVLRDVVRLVEAVEEQKELPLGKNLTLDFDVDQIDESGRPWYELICRYVRDELSRPSGAFSVDGYAGASSRQVIPLRGSILDDFYDLGKKSAVTYGDKSNSTERLVFRDDAGKTDLTVSAMLDKNGSFEGVRLTGMLPALYNGVKYRYSYCPGELCRLENNSLQAIQPLIRSAQGNKVSLRIGRRNLSQFYYNVLPILRENCNVYEPDAEVISGYLLPEAQFTFYLDAVGGSPLCRTAVSYGEETFELFDWVMDSLEYRSLRDTIREASVLQLVHGYFPLVSRKDRVFLCTDDPDSIYRLLTEGLDELVRAGEVMSTPAFDALRVRKQISIRVGVSLESDLMVLQISSEDVTLQELQDILNSYKLKKKYHRLKNGEFVELNDTIEELSSMVDTLGLSPREFIKGKLHLPAYRALYLDKMLEQCGDIYTQRDARFRSMIKNFKAKNVEYKRAMAANDNYTICLPYSAPTISGVKYYELKGIKGSSLQFSEVTQTKPGVPYMVMTTSAVDNFDYDENKNNGASTDIVANVAEGSTGGGYTMYGTYSLISPAETIDKFILQDQGKWQRAKTENPNVYISPFRAYLLSTGGSDDTGSEVDDGTGINNIHTTDLDGTERWYDLNGRIINGAPSKKGVYIRQGKKIVIR